MLKAAIASGVALGVLAGAAVLGGAILEDRPQPQPARPTQGRIAGPQDWATQANGICRRADSEFAHLGRPQTQDETRNFIANLIVANDRWNDALLALPSAPGQEHALRELRLLLTEDERLLKKMLRGLEANDRLGFTRALQRYEQVTAQQQSIFRALGAEDCLSAKSSAIV